jgi:hypothetical protein
MNTDPKSNSAATEGCAPSAGYAPSAWTPSAREEVISALWFIVAGVAHIGGCSPLVFWLIVAKATFDSIESVICAVREWRREDSHTK